jgi:hypothetical protein
MLNYIWDFEIDPKKYGQKTHTSCVGTSEKNEATLKEKWEHDF